MTEKYALVIDGGCKFHGAGGTLNHHYCELARQTLEEMGWSVDVVRAQDQWDAAEQAQKLIEADAVLLQTPIWWMAAPWQVKHYVDEVFCAPGVANGDGRTRIAPEVNYGRGGVRKAHYMISCTWNAPANAFTAPEEFFEGKGIDAVLLPMHKAFQFIGMKPMQTFMANDVVKNPTHEADFKRFVELVRKNFSAL